MSLVFMYICIIEDVVNSLGVVCEHFWSFRPMNLTDRWLRQEGD